MAETGCAAMSHAATREAVLESDRVPTGEQVDSVLAQLQTGVGWRPDDAELHLRLAGAYLLRARLAVLGRLIEIVKVRERRDELRAEEINVLWRQTRPAVLHGRVWELLHAGQHQELEQIRSDPAWRSVFHEALAHLQLSRHHCPLLPWTHVRLAEIGYFGDSPDWDQRDVERARWLAPAEPDVEFRCGLLDLNAGRIESAAASWKRALALSRSHLQEIIDLGPLRLTDAATKFIETVLPEDPLYLVELGRRYAGREDTGLLQALQKRAVELVARDGTSPRERALVLGHVARLNGDVASAVEHFSEVVELQPEDSQTRYLLAQVLNEQGRYEQAMMHARHLSREDVENPQYAALVKKIRSARRTRWTSRP
jgi:tetratricopeptide (TPR) repeat protein